MIENYKRLSDGNYKISNKEVDLIVQEEEANLCNGYLFLNKDRSFTILTVIFVRAQNKENAALKLERRAAEMSFRFGRIATLLFDVNAESLLKTDGNGVRVASFRSGPFSVTFRKLTYSRGWDAFMTREISSEEEEDFWYRECDSAQACLDEIVKVTAEVSVSIGGAVLKAKGTT